MLACLAEQSWQITNLYNIETAHLGSAFEAFSRHLRCLMPYGVMGVTKTKTRPLVWNRFSLRFLFPRTQFGLLRCSSDVRFPCVSCPAEHRVLQNNGSCIAAVSLLSIQLFCSGMSPFCHETFKTMKLRNQTRWLFQEGGTCKFADNTSWRNPVFLTKKPLLKRTHFAS